MVRVLSSFKKYLLFSDSFVYIAEKISFFRTVFLRWLILIFSKDKNVRLIEFEIINKSFFFGDTINIGFEFHNVLFHKIKLNSNEAIFYSKYNFDTKKIEYLICNKNSVLSSRCELPENGWLEIGPVLKTLANKFDLSNGNSNLESIEIIGVGIGNKKLIKKFTPQYNNKLNPKTIDIVDQRITKRLSNNRKIKLDTSTSITLTNKYKTYLSSKSIVTLNKFHLSNNKQLSIKLNRFNKTE